jgi:hypothetical protein
MLTGIVLLWLTCIILLWLPLGETDSESVNRAWDSSPAAV